MKTPRLMKATDRLRWPLWLASGTVGSAGLILGLVHPSPLSDILPPVGLAGMVWVAASVITLNWASERHPVQARRLAALLPNAWRTHRSDVTEDGVDFLPLPRMLGRWGAFMEPVTVVRFEVHGPETPAAARVTAYGYNIRPLSGSIRCHRWAVDYSEDSESERLRVNLRTTLVTRWRQEKMGLVVPSTTEVDTLLGEIEQVYRAA